MGPSRRTPNSLAPCWLWTGRVEKDGYGLSSHLSKRAHRASWIMAYGQIPKGLCVCHSCDTPSCVNPDHLWLGTHVQNNLDMRAKGHLSPLFTLSMNPPAVITDEQKAVIAALTSDGRSVRYIAKHVGLNPSTVYKQMKSLRKAG